MDTPDVQAMSPPRASALVLPDSPASEPDTLPPYRIVFRVLFGIGLVLALCPPVYWIATDAVSMFVYVLGTGAFLCAAIIAMFVVESRYLRSHDLEEQ